MKRIIPCIVITLAMIYAGIFLPVAGVLGLMLCPLPLAVLGCLEGQKKMSIAELMIEGTLFIAVSPSMAVYFLLGSAPLAGFLFMMSRNEFKEIRKFSPAESFLMCLGGSIVFKIILIAAFWIFTGKNVFMPDIQQANLMLFQLYKNQPDLYEAARSVLATLPYLMPAMLVIYASFETFINYSLCNRFMRKFFPTSKNYPPELPEFKLWKFPVSILFASIFALIVGYFFDTDTWFQGAIFIMNLQIAISALMFVQGLSVAFWIMDGFKFRRGTKIFVCFILGIPFFWPWLIVIGMCELALNLKNRIKFKA